MDKIDKLITNGFYVTFFILGVAYGELLSKSKCEIKFKDKTLHKFY